MAYDSNNIFAKILRGELPAQKVYEDADTLAFMDIMPRCEGHTLVIPKTPARNVLDASPAQLAACMRTVQKVAAAAMKASAPTASRCCSPTRPPAGRSCSTCISTSCRAGRACRWVRPASKMEKPEVLAANAEKIKKALAG